MAGEVHSLWSWKVMLNEVQSVANYNHYTNKELTYSASIQT